MTNLIDTIEKNEGYKVLPGFIPLKLISDFKQVLKNLYVVRASSSNKTYVEKDKIKQLSDISIWWSQMVDAFPEMQAIKRLVDPVIANNFKNLAFYASDTVTVNASSKWFSPHVDTPHRFKQWNYDRRLLGIQCIISLDDVNKNNAATGLVPYSQKRDFDIDKCYTGFYDRWFLENCIQPDMPKGSLLLYNCRVLHSSMPNFTDKERPALLLNYLDKSIHIEVSKVDNVWASNG